MKAFGKQKLFNIVSIQWPASLVSAD